MNWGTPDYKDNLLPGTLAYPPAPAFAVRARPSVAAASPNAKGREAAHETALYPDIQPLDFSTDDRLLQTLEQKVTPGYDQSYPNCGQVRFTITCPTDPAHYKKLAKYSCHRSSCPTCWPTWAARLAKEAQSRIDDSRTCLSHDYKARHVSISPEIIPFKDATPEALQWLLKEGNKLTKLLGITGCAVIPHAYRVKKEFKEFVNIAAYKQGLNRYTWILQQGNWRDYLNFSPHLHLETFGKLMESDEFYKRTGWVYRNHDNKKALGREGPELTRTIYYLLTHAWTRDNKFVIRYWGDLSNKRLTRIKQEPMKEQIRCPVCGTHCVKITLDDRYQDLNNAPHAYREIPIYIYERRMKYLPQHRLFASFASIQTPLRDERRKR